VALAVLGLFVLDGTAMGLALAAAAVFVFVGVLRALSSAEMRGVRHGGEGGGFG
jgi:hypothetical protein